MKPLTPIDCDLRNFPFMPLDVVRLRDSDLAALESPEACWAAVLLWSASWHQIPAASLPNDDRVLANLSGFGRVVKEWLKVKDGALRGWVLCDDGRLYHPVIAEKALDAMESKYKQEWRTELARIRKHNQRHPQDLLTEIDYESFMSNRTVKGCPIGQVGVVLELSHEKQHPTDTDTDIDTDINTLSNSECKSNTVPNEATEKTHTQIQIGLIAEGLTAIGMMPFNPQLPKFLALIDAGASVDEFVSTALEKKGTDKFNFSYLLSAMTNRRLEAAKALPLHKGSMPAATSREAGRNVAAKSIFTPENTQHLQGNQLKTINEVDHEEPRAIAA